MFETVRYETERRVRGTALFVVIVSLYGAFVVGLFPSFMSSGTDFNQLMSSYPEPLQKAFGIESLGTIEGFLSSQFYSFVWVLLLGVYFAYRAGGIVTADIEQERMDLLVSLPVSRAQLLTEKYLSVLVPIGALTLGVFPVIYLGTVLVGHPVDPVALAMVHLLGVPYLLACSGLGLGLSVLTSRTDIAQRSALGVMFGLYLLESIAATVDQIEFLTYLSPTFHYTPSEILVNNQYSPGSALVLLAVAVLLHVGSRQYFSRRDL